MSDLRTRFREADRLPAPDLWADILTREPREAARPQLWPRVAVAAAALAVAGLGLVLLARAFLPGTMPAEEPTPTPTGGFRPGPKANGVIAFVRTDPDSMLQEGGIPVSALHAVEADGSGGRRLLEWNELFRSSVAWSPDGSRMAFLAFRGIEVVNAEGDEARKVTRCAPPDCELDDLPSWSPDGQRLAFSRYTSTGERNPLMVVDLVSGEATVLNRMFETTRAVAWSPTGDVIAVLGYVGPSPEAAPHSIHFVDANTGEIRQTIPSPEGLEFLNSLSWSPDAKWIAFEASGVGGSPQEAGIYVMRADGSDVRLLTACTVPKMPGRCWDLNPSWSPDGSQIAYTRAGPEPGSDGFMGDIFVIDVDGGAARQVTRGPGLDCCPAWQPLPAG